MNDKHGRLWIYRYGDEISHLTAVPTIKDTKRLHQIVDTLCGAQIFSPRLDGVGRRTRRCAACLARATESNEAKLRSAMETLWKRAGQFFGAYDQAYRSEEHTSELQSRVDISYAV